MKARHLEDFKIDDIRLYLPTTALGVPVFWLNKSGVSHLKGNGYLAFALPLGLPMYDNFVLDSVKNRSYEIGKDTSAIPWTWLAEDWIGANPSIFYPLKTVSSMTLVI